MTYYGDARRPHPYFEARFRRFKAAFEKLGFLPIESPSGDDYLVRVILDGRPLVFSAEALPINSAAAQMLARDKLSTYQILIGSGVRVPRGLAFFAAVDRGRPTGVEEHLLVGNLRPRLVAAFPEVMHSSCRMVVKPGRESHGIGVGFPCGLQRVLEAAPKVLEYGRYGLVQEFVDGNEYRIVILDESVLVKYRKHGARLVGDGTQTERELVLTFNALHRRSAYDKALLDLENLPPLAGGRLWDLDYVPAKGEVLELAVETHNLSQGAWPEVVEEVPGDGLRVALQAHRALGLRYSGVDLRVPEGGLQSVILEVNANPGFDHLERYEPELVAQIAERVASKIVETSGQLGQVVKE